jgi:hypothetical protein
MTPKTAATPMPRKAEKVATPITLMILRRFLGPMNLTPATEMPVWHSGSPAQRHFLT